MYFIDFAGIKYEWVGLKIYFHIKTSRQAWRQISIGCKEGFFFFNSMNFKVKYPYTNLTSYIKMWYLKAVRYILDNFLKPFL